jgi:hypothetical protein
MSNNNNNNNISSSGSDGNKNNLNFQSMMNNTTTTTTTSGGGGINGINSINSSSADNYIKIYQIQIKALMNQRKLICECLYYACYRLQANEENIYQIFDLLSEMSDCFNKKYEWYQDLNSQSKKSKIYQLPSHANQMNQDLIDNNNSSSSDDDDDSDDSDDDGCCCFDSFDNDS